MTVVNSSLATKDSALFYDPCIAAVDQFLKAARSHSLDCGSDLIFEHLLVGRLIDIAEDAYRDGIFRVLHSGQHVSQIRVGSLFIMHYKVRFAHAVAKLYDFKVHVRAY